MGKLVYGVGVNDADYAVYACKRVEGQLKTIWTCPIYERWKDMLKRCYSEVYQKKYPSYVGCSVVPQWLKFSEFRKWMIEQDWEGKQLDKDLIYPGNKVYGPTTCVFLSSQVNNFIINKPNALLNGVKFNDQTQRYQARGTDVETGKQKHLGYFDTPEEAFNAWRVYKLKQATILANQQSNPVVSKALIERFAF